RAAAIRARRNPGGLDAQPEAELEPTVTDEAAAEDVVPGLEDADLVLEGNIDVAPAPEKKKAAPPPPPPPKLKPLGRPLAGKAAAEPPRVKPGVPRRPSAPTPA